MTHTITLIKFCNKCGKGKSLDKFYRDRYNKDGYYTICKTCKNIQTILWRKKKGKEYSGKLQRQYRRTTRGRLTGRFFNIKQRCENPKNKDYKRYGGRGIKCKFQSANDFIEHILNDLQIDRIDNNGHYEKGNIKLTTAKEQANNRRDNV